MVHLYDIMRQAQSGTAFENLSRQFGLSGHDTQRAIDALLPAFSLGFQRHAQDPNSFVQLLEMMTSGRMAPFFEAPGSLSNPQAVLAGGEMLTKIFGSPEVTRQIAAQGSAMTGIAVQVLQQMMPMIAAVLVGGLQRHVSLEGIGDTLAQWSDIFRRAAAAQARQARPETGFRSAERPSSGMGNPIALWADTIGALFGTAREAKPVSQPAAQPNGSATDPWSAFMAALAPEPAAPAAPPPAPPSRAGWAPIDVLAQMLETGREVQSQHLAALQSIFDTMWGVRRT